MELKGIFLVVILLFTTALLTHIFFVFYSKVAQRANLVHHNYRGIKIPQGLGIIIPGVLIVMLLIDLYLLHTSILTIETMPVYVVLITALGTIGWLDDHYGNPLIKGFKGHIGLFIKEGKIGTGLLKLIVGLLLGIWISCKFREPLIERMLSLITFGLWTNIINLLDVRPGRAIKGFWFVSAVLYALFIMRSAPLIFYFFWVITVILFISDSRERGMLGDAGANILGGLIGLWIVMMSNFGELLFFCFVALWITIYAEKYSISKWIEKHPLLFRIDLWGRKT